MYTEEAISIPVLFSKILGSIQEAVAFSLLFAYSILFDTYYLAILRAHLKAIKKAALVVNVGNFCSLSQPFYFPVHLLYSLDTFIGLRGGVV